MLRWRRLSPLRLALFAVCGVSLVFLVGLNRNPESNQSSNHGAERHEAAEIRYRQAENARNPSLPGRRSWDKQPPEDITLYDGPTDVMKRNAFDEKISNELPSNREIPDSRSLE